MVEEPQVVVHEGHEPDVFADLAHADFLAGEHPTEIDLPPSDADTATGRDRKGAIVEGILQVLYRHILAVPRMLEASVDESGRTRSCTAPQDCTNVAAQRCIPYTRRST